LQRFPPVHHCLAVLQERRAGRVHSRGEPALLGGHHSHRGKL